MNDLPPRARDIAMVFQDYALYPHKTVFENMAFGLRLRKRPEHEIRTRVGDAAGVLQITHLLERKPRELSGGQRQRVAMGRAIVRQPKAFLFDEPLSNLDALLRAEMRVEIKKLHQQLGNTIIYVTHDQVEAMTLADRIVVLQAGNLIQYDTPDGDLQPAGREVRRRLHGLAADELRAAAASAKAGARCTCRRRLDLPVPANRVAECARHQGRALTFGLRPEHIGVARRRDAATRRAPRRRPGDAGRAAGLGHARPDPPRRRAATRREMTGRFPPEAKLSVGQALPCRAVAGELSTCSIPDTGVAIRGADW